ncbi:MAG: hypothetical protein E7Z89_02370 [Cyanobacteria bacterium SIG28]|nr:hypothetical protein [Cyanobacteria bacterium SIG28]
MIIILQFFVKKANFIFRCFVYDMNMQLPKIGIGNFNLFKPKVKVESMKKLLSTGEIPALFKKDLATIQDDQTREILTKTMQYFLDMKGSKARSKALQIDDIVHKYNSCEDAGYKKSFETFIPEILDKSAKEKGWILDVVETGFDAINSANEQYINFKNHKASPAVIMATKLMLLFKRITEPKNKNYKNTPYNYLDTKKLTYCNAGITYFVAKKKGVDINPESKEFQDYCKYEPLERFIKKYSSDYKKLSNYLWKKCFLNKQSVDKRDFYAKIDKWYDTKVLDYSDDSKLDEEKKYFVLSELKCFKDAGKDKAYFPNIIKVNPNDISFLMKVNGGYYTFFDDIIVLPQWNTKRTLRHEMVHLNDNNLYEGWKGHEFTPEIEEEMRKLGFSESYIKYAKTALIEAKAVIGTGVFDRFSDNLKNYVVDAGLPSWILGLKKTSFKNFILDTKKGKLKPEQVKMLDELEKKMTFISYNAYQRIVKDDMQHLGEFYKLFKDKNEVNVRDFVKTCDLYFEIRLKRSRIKSFDVTIDCMEKEVERIKQEEPCWIDMLKKYETLIDDLTTEKKKLFEEINQAEIRLQDLTK